MPSTPSPTPPNKKRLSDEDVPVAKSKKIDYHDTLLVLVGDKEKPSTIHKDLVCAKSRFFAAACARKEWIESQEKTIRLPEADVDAFQSYVHWVYREIVQHDVGDNTPGYKKYHRHLRLYVLADVLQDLELRNKEMNAFIDACATTALLPGFKHINYIFVHTPESSLMRQMVVELYISRFKRERFAEEIDLYPRDFVNAIAMKTLAKAQVLSDETEQAPK